MNANRKCLSPFAHVPKQNFALQKRIFFDGAVIKLDSRALSSAGQCTRSLPAILGQRMGHLCIGAELELLGWNMYRAAGTFEISSVAISWELRAYKSEPL